MPWSRWLARQLGSPGGLFGPLAGRLWNRRNAALNDTAFALLELKPDDRVLDVGFGGGYLLNRMRAVVTDGSLTGVDNSVAMVAFCKKRYPQAVHSGKLDLKLAPVENLPFPDGSFTKACSVNSLFYWQNMEQGVCEIRRVLAAGGLVVLCFTCKSSLESRNFSTHLRLVEADEVERIISDCGFTDLHTRFYSDRYREYVCLTAQRGA